jgi:hypothetical protein
VRGNVASPVPLPSYVVPGEPFPLHRHEFEQCFAHLYARPVGRGLPVGEVEPQQIWFPAELATCCEHLVNVRVSVNGRGHNGNLMGVQSGDCNGSTLECRR